MIYLSSFMLSNKQVKNPNIYPYNVFRGKYIEPFVFSPITVFYGNNGSGKSTLLNIIANKLQLKGKIYNIDTKEYDVVKWNELENVQYFYNFFKKHEQEFEEVIHESGE